MSADESSAPHNVSRLLRWFGPTASPWRIGFLTAGSLLGAFVVWELAFGRFALALAQGPPHAVVSHIRIAVTHIVVVAYLVGATAYALRSMDQAVRRIAPHLAERAAAEREKARSRRRSTLAVWATVGVLAALVIIAVSPGEDHFVLRELSAETIWHRGLAVTIGFWLSRLAGLAGLQSVALSRLAADVRRVDLLTLEPLTAIGRFGLSNALIGAGFVATYALFLVDVEYLIVAPLPVLSALVISTLGLVAPLRGARRRIQHEKQAELSATRAQIRNGHSALTRGASAPQLGSWLAWESRIQEVREWPLDAGSFGRFALYLLIPLGSWGGGALAERLLDWILA